MPKILAWHFAHFFFLWSPITYHLVMLCSFCINFAVADCGSPLVVENATESGRRNSSEGASLGTTVTYTCINGFVLNGENTSTCQGDSTWSSPPTCERTFPILLQKYMLQ